MYQEKVSLMISINDSKANNKQENPKTNKLSSYTKL